MPEFILDPGTPESARVFGELDSFTQGYIKAMFFTDSEPGTTAETWNPETQSSLPGDVGFADLAPEALQAIIADCKAFQETHAALLDQACELVPGEPDFRYAREPLSYERLGMLFWYAGRGHGVSFTDDGDARCLEALQVSCGFGTPFSDRWTTFGDDGQVYYS